MPYESPDMSPVETIFEPIERRGRDFAVRLTESYFALSLALREKLLALLLKHLHQGDRTCRGLLLFDSRDGRMVGSFSHESGLHLMEGFRPR